MKKTLLSLAVLAVTATSAATIPVIPPVGSTAAPEYKREEATGITLNGRASLGALDTRGDLDTKDEADSSFYYNARLGITGEINIGSDWTGVARAEVEIGDSSLQDDVIFPRDVYVGIKHDQAGEIYIGRQTSAFDTVVGMGDTSVEFGNAVNPGFGQRQDKILKYKNSTNGFDYAFTYEFEDDDPREISIFGEDALVNGTKDSNFNTNYRAELATKYAHESGIELGLGLASFDYSSETFLNGTLADAEGFDYYVGAGFDLGKALASSFGSSSKGDTIYLGAGYYSSTGEVTPRTAQGGVHSIGDTDLELGAGQSVEITETAFNVGAAVKGYPWEFGLGYETGEKDYDIAGTKLTENTHEHVYLGTTYNITDNWEVYAEYDFNLLDEEDDVNWNGEDSYIIGTTYNF